MILKINSNLNSVSTFEGFYNIWQTFIVFLYRNYLIAKMLNDRIRKGLMIVADRKNVKTPFRKTAMFRHELVLWFMAFIEYYHF